MAETRVKDTQQEKKELESRKRVMSQASGLVWEQAPADDKGIKMCPWCGWQGVIGNEEDKTPFRNHVKEAHPLAVLAFYADPDAGFDAIRELGGMEEEEDPDYHPFKDQIDVTDWPDFDMLEVPQSTRDKYKNKGGKFRWATDERIQFYLDRGAQVVQREDGAEGPRQGDHSDTRMRMNEHTLIHFPEPVMQKFEQAKKMRINQQGDLKGTAEQAAQKMGDIGEKAYNFYKKRGMTHENAMRMANKAESSHHNEGPDLREPGERRFIHTR